MKRYFIILIALVISFALPVFAGTPTAENAPAAGEEDAWLWLNSLSEEELIQIFGQITIDNVDGSNTFNPFTQTGTTSDGKKFRIEKMLKIKYYFLAGCASLSLALSAITQTGDTISTFLKNLGIITTSFSAAVVGQTITIACVVGACVIATVVIYDILENGTYVYTIIYY